MQGIYNLFREIFKFHKNVNTLENFAKSVVVHIFAKFKQAIYLEPPNQVL